MKKKKEKIDWRIVCIGIVCITVLELFALSQGINGTILSIVIAILALAIGITIPLDKIIRG